MVRQACLGTTTGTDKKKVGMSAEKRKADRGKATERGYDVNELRSALQAVLEERVRQDNQYGVQDHPAEWWLVILGEEYGELCQVALETHFDNGPDKRCLGGVKNLRTEAVQVAAVALAMVESIDRCEAAARETSETGA